MRDRILREVPEKRERCVKHFQMTQKGMAAAVYPAPVHYEEDGKKLITVWNLYRKTGEKFIEILRPQFV